MEKSGRRNQIKEFRKRVLARAGFEPGELFVRRPKALPVAPEEPDPRKRVLILTADVGFGHRRAAMALASALEEKYGERCAVTIANPLSDKRAPVVLRRTQVEYDRLVRELPEIYRLQYQITFSSVSVAVIEPMLTAMLFGVLNDVVREVRPDVVVATHPYYIPPMAALHTLGSFTGSLMTVITDLTNIHKIWFNDAAEMTFLPTENTRLQAVEQDLPESKLLVTGIPVDPSLLHEVRSKAEIRAQMGWDVDLPLVLVVGSKRVKGLPAALNVLNHSGIPFQMVIVAGGDDKLYARLQEEEWHKPTHLYNFVDQMPAFLRSADCIVTKAGGLIVSEALASGLPLLLVDVTPGQEEGNAQYVVENGAAQLAPHPLEVLEAAFHWMENDASLLAQQAARAAALGRPNSAFEIAATVIAAAERGLVPVPENRKALIPTLKELLSRSGINIDFLQ